MKTITAKMLEEKKACAVQVALFRKTFPRGCRLTLANVEKAQRVGLNIEWAVGRFATKPHRDVYYAATQHHRDAYSAAIKPHWDAYYAATQHHRDAYSAATQHHRDAYSAAIKPHRDAYYAAATKEALKALLGEDAP